MNIGELFVLGFQGKVVPRWLREFADQFGLGGAILFDYDYQAKAYDNNIHSPEQVRALCDELHALNGAPRILIDQEGGKVRRLKEKLGFAPLPSAKALAALSAEERDGILRRSFSEMSALGIDIDLAPVVDIDLNPANPNIGAIERSFSSDPEVVRRTTLALDRIARETGLQLCLKHYPGLGSASTDSHLDLTDVTATLTTAEEQLFYELGTKVSGEMVLISHAFNTRWDDKFPVSVSQNGIARLRAQLPDALLVTDDLQMQGLQKICHTALACRRAIAFGVDWVLIGNNLMREEPAIPEIARGLRMLAERDEHFHGACERAIARVQRRKTQRGG
jgi:beta-N-acetylhexosaminidase